MEGAAVWRPLPPASDAVSPQASLMCNATASVTANRPNRYYMASASSMRTGPAVDERHGSPHAMDGPEGRQGAYELRPELCC